LAAADGSAIVPPPVALMPRDYQRPGRRTSRPATVGGSLGRMTAFAALLVSVLLLALWVGPAWRPRPLPGVDRRRPLALGHRGVRGPLPENTLAAFRAALDGGLDGLETDVQRTRDGALVLVHDPEVGGRRVTASTLAELRAVTPELTTLDDLLGLVRAHPGTLLNVELKTLGLADGGLARAAADALMKSGLTDRLLVSSFNPLALLRLRLRAPELRTAYLWMERPEVPRLLRHPWPGTLLHVDALHPHHHAVTPAAVRTWHDRGLAVNTWTVNGPEDVARVVAAGVDGVMADLPEPLLAALGRPPGESRSRGAPAASPVAPPGGPPP
jgi:glycerophosphoryl diester phosphodiesterase